MIAQSTSFPVVNTSAFALKVTSPDPLWPSSFERVNTNASIETTCTLEDVNKVACFAACGDSLLNLCQEDTEDRLSTNGSELSRTSTPLSKELLEESDPFEYLTRWMSSSTDEKDDHNLLKTMNSTVPNSNIFEGMEERVMEFLNSECITMKHPGQDRILEVKRPNLTKEVGGFCPKRNSLACRRAMNLKVAI